MFADKKIKPATFLDRDGVINIDHGHVGKEENIDYIDGSLEAIKYLKDIGYRVFIVTNQAGIAKDLYTKSDYQKCMQKIKNDLVQYNADIDDIRFCPFHKNAIKKCWYHENHPWRKPNPGMILDLLKQWPTNLNLSFLVGDKSSDIEAANNSKINGYLFKQDQNLLTFVKNIPEIIEWNRGVI